MEHICPPYCFTCTVSHAIYPLFEITENTYLGNRDFCRHLHRVLEGYLKCNSEERLVMRETLEPIISSGFESYRLAVMPRLAGARAALQSIEPQEVPMDTEEAKLISGLVQFIFVGSALPARDADAISVDVAHWVAEVDEGLALMLKELGGVMIGILEKVNHEQYPAYRDLMSELGFNKTLSVLGPAPRRRETLGLEESKGWLEWAIEGITGVRWHESSEA